MILLQIVRRCDQAASEEQQQALRSPRHSDAGRHVTAAEAATRRPRATMLAARPAPALSTRAPFATRTAAGFKAVYAPSGPPTHVLLLLLRAPDLGRTSYNDGRQAWPRRGLAGGHRRHRRQGGLGRAAGGASCRRRCPAA